MSSFLVIILALAGALVPGSANEFTLDMGGKTMVFERQPDKIWAAKKIYPNGKVKDAGKFKIDGLNVGMEHKGEFRNSDLSKFFGVNTVEELKKLSKLSLGKDTMLILKQEKGFSLKPENGPEFKVSWK
jgi:hypothetical protein